MYESFACKVVHAQGHLLRVTCEEFVGTAQECPAIHCGRSQVRKSI